MPEYKDLKHSENGMPTWNTFIPIVLSVAMDNKIWSGSALKRASVEIIKNLPNDLKTIKYKDTEYETILENRAGFALSLLTNAELIERPERGKYVISDSGKNLFNQKGYELTKKLVKELPAYKKHKKLVEERKSGKVNQEESFSESVTPEEQMGAIETEYNSDIAINLLSKLRESESTYFEGLVVNLLVKMGYQGKNGQSIVTKRSNDGGIDGIINQDALGTQTVYIQAKCHKEGNNVGREDIQKFVGALADAHGNKGVFITTSKFTSGAIKSAENNGIILIDGNGLTNLMLKYRLGVQVKRTFELLDIDEDFFEDLS